MPIWRSVAAAAIPPIPAPTMAMESFFAPISCYRLNCNCDFSSSSIKQTQGRTFFVAPASRRRFCRFSTRCKNAGGAPAPQDDHSLRSCGRTRFAFNLRAVPDAARTGIKRIAPVHGAAVVPQDEVANAPFVVPLEFFAVRLQPQFIEQGFRLRE